jgi:CheY-like chemotaxis protein
MVPPVGEPSILIIHPDRKTQRTVQRILGSTGYRIDIADTAEQGIHLIEDLSPVLVVVDGALPEREATALLAAAKSRGTEACMTLFGPRADAAVPALLGLGAVTNLLIHPLPALAEELTITAQKLIRGDLFGAEKYLLWGSDFEEITLARGSQRAEIIGQLADRVRGRGQSARIASMAMLVTDELISNAIHNAPVNDAGVHYRKELPRDQELPLDGRHAVRLRWGCDARFLAVEVTDYFGSLDRDTILNALARHDVRDSGGGAGMGLALTYGSCDHLIFNLAPGTRTEVIALIDVRHPPTERTVSSSYNVFVEKPRPS